MKTQTWNINGIEFEAVVSVEQGSILEVGLVQNPEHADIFFFGPNSLKDSELEQLVDEGWLEPYRPWWGVTDTGCFCLRLVVDDKGNFIDGSEPADCIVCKRAFNFIDNGDNVIVTHPATGPSYSSGGEPAEWDSACTECIGSEFEEPEPDYDPDDDYERGL